MVASKSKVLSSINTSTCINTQNQMMAHLDSVEFVIISIGSNNSALKDILKELDPHDEIESNTSYTWHLKNKYFKADVNIYCCSREEFLKNFLEFRKLEAVLFTFDAASSDSFCEIEKTSHLFKEDESPELRMVWETSNKGLEDATKDKYFSWCLDHQFELIENMETGEEADEDSFGVKYGVDRIKEALRSHMWANHQMIEPDEKPKKPSTTTVHNEQQTMTEQNEDLFHDNESFEDLFNKLHVMKEQAQNLDGDARKDYAEKVAYAFMEALGIDDGESDSEDR
uniref:Uncharacterized protein n=2 Tax=Clytia hemisphaerica TaxID=252671 RepID=A0A7M5WQ13_9CNID